MTCAPVFRFRCHLRWPVTALAVLIAAFSHGAQPPETGQPNSFLREQFSAGEYNTVLKLSEERVAAMDTRFQRYQPELFEPLLLRADAFFALQEYDASILAYRHALQVLRMNAGLHSEEQVPIFRRLAEAHQMLGLALEANNFEEAAFAAAEHNSDATSTDLLDDIQRLARWYLKAGYYTSARKLLERARDLAAANLPEQKQAYANSLDGIAATYVGLAFSEFDRESEAYYSQFTPANTQLDKHIFGRLAGPEGSHASAFRRFHGGEQALNQLVAFLREGNQAQKPDHQASLIEALINLGDWHVRFRDSRAALRAFREARSLMSDEAVEREFGSPKLLFMPKIEAPVSCFAENCDEEITRSSALETGEIRFSVKVNNHGTVSRVTKVASTPVDFSAFRYKQETRRARFRPAIVDDRFQDQQVVPVVHRFQYVAHNPKSSP